MFQNIAEIAKAKRGCGGGLYDANPFHNKVTRCGVRCFWWHCTFVFLMMRWLLVYTLVLYMESRGHRRRLALGLHGVPVFGNDVTVYMAQKNRGVK